MDNLCEDCRGLGLCLCVKRQQGWISVEDGLPEQYDHVFVTDKTLVGSAFYQDGSFVNESVEFKAKITHWMPLPQPPTYT